MEGAFVSPSNGVVWCALCGEENPGSVHFVVVHGQTEDEALNLRNLTDDTALSDRTSAVRPVGSSLATPLSAPTSHRPSERSERVAE